MGESIGATYAYGACIPPDSKWFDRPVHEINKALAGFDEISAEAYGFQDDPFRMVVVSRTVVMSDQHSVSDVTQELRFSEYVELRKAMDVLGLGDLKTGWLVAPWHSY